MCLYKHAQCLPTYMQVFMLLEEMSMEFEEAVKLGGGWTELALPSEEEAHRYFASFRRAPPDNSALAPGTQVGDCTASAILTA